MAGGADLITAGEYRSFELSLEWMIEPRGNSGIMYRVTEADSFSYETGPEYQILDDAGHRDGLSRLTAAEHDDFLGIGARCRIGGDVLGERGRRGEYRDQGGPGPQTGSERIGHYESPFPGADMARVAGALGGRYCCAAAEA